ncbi:hypothetical protein [Gimesia algae]|uniref:Uncharacterized protein n=1 Tax=Gimesia algae TaxID=2527971 RepID=A0A517VGJ9_9PLAN|nr:hypothetical protein [Gimesia algae]QDT92146.1 hypothetical protein Pan161_38120 [Gimesia algae]
MCSQRKLCLQILNLAILMTMWGCTPSVPDTPSGNSSEVTTETQSKFASAAEVTAALEARWSLDDIKTYCVPERRHNPTCQNLVTDVGVTWEGTLYENEPTGFDSISWYGTAVEGRLHEYSLGVSRGENYWLLEIGNVDSFDRQPRVAPDPSGPCFIGSAPPENQESDNSDSDLFVEPVKRE